VTTVFLYTFFVGFGLTLVSAVLGAVDASGIGHGHAGDLSGGHADAGAHGHASAVSPVNFQTLMAFLMGFGGVGYLAAEAGWAFWLAAVPAGVAGGVTIAWLIYRFMRFLVKGERPLPPTSYVGVIGKLTVGIREGGTGELVYSQNGVRMVTAARSSDGAPIARGEQVVVLRYAKGVAYVEPWRELLKRDP
jgi:hypothetical protein